MSLISASPTSLHNFNAHRRQILRHLEKSVAAVVGLLACENANIAVLLRLRQKKSLGVGLHQQDWQHFVEPLVRQAVGIGGAARRYQDDLPFLVELVELATQIDRLAFRIGGSKLATI